jgi:hypothetical protein
MHYFAKYAAIGSKYVYAAIGRRLGRRRPVF